MPIFLDGIRSTWKKTYIILISVLVALVSTVLIALAIASAVAFTVAVATCAIIVIALVAAILSYHHLACSKWMYSIAAKCRSTTRSDEFTNDEVNDQDVEAQDNHIFLPLIGDPEDAIQAWRDYKERGDDNEVKNRWMPMLCCYPKWFRTIQTHCQCISPGASELLGDICGKMLCFTLGLGCCCTSHLGIEENSRQADSPQEITHKWSIEQAHDLKNVTINLGDPTAVGI